MRLYADAILDRLVHNARRVDSSATPCAANAPQKPSQTIDATIQQRP